MPPSPPRPRSVELSIIIYSVSSGNAMRHLETGIIKSSPPELWNYGIMEQHRLVYLFDGFPFQLLLLDAKVRKKHRRRRRRRKRRKRKKRTRRFWSNCDDDFFFPNNRSQNKNKFTIFYGVTFCLTFVLHSLIYTDPW